MSECLGDCEKRSFVSSVQAKVVWYSVKGLLLLNCRRSQLLSQPRQQPTVALVFHRRWFNGSRNVRRSALPRYRTFRLQLISPCSPGSRWMTFGLRSAQLFSKIFNLCGHDPPTSQTDGRTDGQTDGMRSQDRALHCSTSRGKNYFNMQPCHWKCNASVYVMQTCVVISFYSIILQVAASCVK